MKIAQINDLSMKIKHFTQLKKNWKKISGNVSVQ